MKTLALAIAGLLATPVALANCDIELQQIEQRVKSADMDPQNEQVLVDWLAEQRIENATTPAAQCTALAAEIERQMREKGYFVAAASLESDPLGTDPAYAGTTGEAQGDEIAIAASPAEIVVQQPAADVDVTQQPAEVQVEMEPAEVLVQVPEPRVKVTQPPPQVTVHQPDPTVTIEQQDPQVSVDQAEPNVSISQGEPQVRIEQGEPQVSVQQSDPIVDVQSSDPEVEVQQADGGTVAIGESAGESALAGTETNDSEYAYGESAAQLGSDTDSMASAEDDGAPEAIWEREEARDGLDEQVGTFDASGARQVAVSELVGDIVVDENGQRVGRVIEALTESGSDAVYLRVDVAATSDMESDELVLAVHDLKADHSGQLRVNGDSELVFNAAASRSSDGMHPADGETALLAGEWE